MSKQPVLGRKHDQWRIAETLILLDQSTSLIAVKPGHHNVTEDHRRLMVCNFCKRIKAIFGQHHLTSRLNEKNLGTTPNGVAIVDDHHFDAAQVSCFSQFLPPERPAVGAYKGFRQCKIIMPR